MSQPIELHPHNPQWPTEAQAELEAVRAALGGYMWEGGEVLGQAHVGSTSVEGLWAKPCLDLAVTVGSFPLAAEYISRLEALGFEYRGENGIAGREYFTKGAHRVHLHLYLGGDMRYDQHLLFRDYLRANTSAKERYQALKLELAQVFGPQRAAYTEGKAPLIERLLDQAQVWWVGQTGLGPVEWMAAELAGCGVDWFLSSGWALEVWAGEASRLHQDLDVGVWRQDQQALLRYLQAKGWDLQVTQQGRYRPWQGEWLNHPEVTQVHARKVGMPFELLDILLCEHQEGVWWYRRDPRITLPQSQAVLQKGGYRVLEPTICLLFKARTADKDPRPKDQADFERALPLLSPAQKDWLKQALELWQPSHPWLKAL